MKTYFSLRASFAAALLGAFAVSPGLATGPSTQIIRDTQNGFLNAEYLYSVVEMRRDRAADRANGTGSVIDKHVDEFGNGWFCVLTADHVTAAGGRYIGFGNGNPQAGNRMFGNPQGDLLHSFSAQGLDLAVLGVPYGGPPDAFFNSIIPLSMIIGYNSPNDLTNSRAVFTEIGYGDTGDPGVDTDGSGGLTSYTSYGVKRYQNNRFERSQIKPYGSGNYTSIEWDYDNPAGAFATPGEGSSYAGDSGGPYFMTDGIGPDSPNGHQHDITTNGIVAVHTYGDNTNFHNYFGHPDHVASGGVFLTTAIVNAIRTECESIPEPAGLCLIVIGLIAMRKRR